MPVIGSPWARRVTASWWQSTSHGQLAQMAWQSRTVRGDRALVNR